MTLNRIVRVGALVFAVCGTALGIGCAAPPDDEGELTGTAQIAITNVPLDGSVLCIQVTATSNISVEKILDVSPGQSTVFQLSGLPVGSVAFTGDAFAASCQGVFQGMVPTWVSDPVVAFVSTSPPVSLSLQMRRNGQAEVGVDFPPEPSCGAIGAPCLSNAECCSGSCSAGFCAAGNQGCVTAADCPAPSNECAQSVCTAGQCGLTPAPAGTVVSTQVAGDCQILVCDGGGNLTSMIDDTDIVDDGNQCTEDMCINGVATNLASPLGKPCNQNGGVICAGATCVECGHDFDCPGSALCINYTCQVVSCSDGIKNGPETDVDCGSGYCPGCADGKACVFAYDCTSHVCSGNVCQVPSCVDTVKNGTETDVDCGGACTGCANGHYCNVGSDCASGNCVNSVCHA